MVGDMLFGDEDEQYFLIKFWDAFSCPGALQFSSRSVFSIGNIYIYIYVIYSFNSLYEYRSVM